MEPKLVPIPAYGDVMTIAEFDELVADGSFVDYDGHGKYANVDSDGNGVMASEPSIHPSTFSARIAELSGYTHVVWFNK